MHVTLTNLTEEQEVLAAPDGSVAVVLHPHTPYQLNQEETQVLVVGDKPDVRETLKQAASKLGQVVADLVHLILGRKEHAVPRTGALEEVRIVVANHGANAVRAILGDGTTEQTVSPGSTSTVAAQGYVELRELGTAPQDNPNSSGLVAP